jgi:alkyl hydroperoxide reductase subunit AhpC
MLRLGDIAPDFEADCLFPGQNALERVKFSEFCTSSTWTILFSHPADFTPVCTTELARVNHLAPEWAKRSCRVIGLSTDSVSSHRSWSQDIVEYESSRLGNGDQDQMGQLNFPIIADEDLKVATLYGMLDQESNDPGNFDPKTRAPLPIRTVFIIDPKRRIRLTMTYPAAIGRSFDEILRTLDALQRSDSFKIATPADWKQGQDVIIRFDVKDSEADTLFPNRPPAFKPYLRFTSDPKN